MGEPLPLFPYCGGRIITTNPDYSETERLQKANSHIDTIIRHNITQLEKECQRLKRVTRRLNYYLDVHNVTDEDTIPSPPFQPTSWKPDKNAKRSCKS